MVLDAKRDNAIALVATIVDMGGKARKVLRGGNQQRISDHLSESGQEAEPEMPASPQDTWLGSRGGGACVQESAQRGALDSPFKGPDHWWWA